MRLARFEVHGLFGMNHHAILFPVAELGDPQPSIVILHGPNGVGKTTVLRMLRGLIYLDFEVFRAVPFARCTLAFDDESEIRVFPAIEKKRPVLRAEFDGLTIHMHARRAGTAFLEDAGDLDAFRQAFYTATDSLQFVFIDTQRFATWHAAYDGARLGVERPTSALAPAGLAEYAGAGSRGTAAVGSRASRSRPPGALAEQVLRFISDAQANYTKFFTNKQSETVFGRLLHGLASGAGAEIDADETRRRLDKIFEQDEAAKRFGLEPDVGNVDRLLDLLPQGGDSPIAPQVLVALTAYTDVLEVRSNERAGLAARLSVFEQTFADFLDGKEIRIDATTGLRITDAAGRRLTEHQLSSGEYHLLYLMVTALTVQRKGTVLAIDEPELSMHLAWQRRLVRALCDCAAGAEPQFIFATHSPDIAADYPQAMVRLTPEVELTSGGTR